MTVALSWMPKTSTSAGRNPSLRRGGLGRQAGSAHAAIEFGQVQVSLPSAGHRHRHHAFIGLGQGHDCGTAVGDRAAIEQPERLADRPRGADVLLRHRRAGLGAVFVTGVLAHQHGEQCQVARVQAVDVQVT